MSGRAVGEHVERLLKLKRAVAWPPMVMRGGVMDPSERHVRQLFGIEDESQKTGEEKIK